MKKKQSITKENQINTKVTPINPRTVIIVTWKKTGIEEAYTSITCFLQYHKPIPGRSAQTIFNYITRAKTSYMDEEVIIKRHTLIGRK